MLNWIDLCIAVFFVGMFVLEFKRGFGMAIFDLAALLVALRATWELNEPISRSLPLMVNPHANQAAVYALVFVVIAAALVLVGRLLHSTTLVTTGVFDPMLGAMCGVAIATIASHVLVQTMAFGAGGTAVPEVVASSALGTEFLRFETYHQVLELLYNFHRTPEV